MKYGFVYIWYDRKHKRYYIGAHWGSEDDGYICSSPWMKQAYNKRPNDFKRRILSKIYTSRQDMFNEEAKWQSLIKDSELRIRYYNIKRHGDRHWSTDENKALAVKEKIKASDNTRGIRQYWKDKSKSEEHKKKISDSLKGRPLSYIVSNDTRKKISDNSKRLQKEKKIGMHGKKHSEKTLELMSKNNAMNNPEYRDKIGKANRGTKGLLLNGIKKMAKPGSNKWKELISLGFEPMEKS